MDRDPVVDGPLIRGFVGNGFRIQDSRVDAVLMLYQSKFSVAAMMRGAVRYGQRELYQNTRITHSLVDPLVNEMKNGGWSRANEERKRMWTKLWDLFGPEGSREGLRTSSYASQ